jgi:phosphoglycerol transferase MdoB-like AlkP superfamily enzyme
MAARSLAHGPLRVPAWGANTVRSEFSFLAGEDLAALGVHRFQPYWAVKRGLAVTALPEYLRRLGYRTIAVHPYPASFYRRDAVFPRLGFDRLLDLSSFTGAARFGPYISDVAVAAMVEDLLRAATEPTFVFVITMENHGPLHLERVTNDDIAEIYDQPPPTGCDDLTVYLRHLCNADRMLDRLQHALIALPRPASLCWYGDHVPIMPAVYKTLGAPSGETSYLIWRTNQQADNIPARPLAIQDLASVWLKHQVSCDSPIGCYSPKG